MVELRKCELSGAPDEGQGPPMRWRRRWNRASLRNGSSRGSTGFGKGVAVPHVKHKSVTQMSAAIGLSQGGIEFASLDKQPVYSVFLLLSPEDKPEDHLQAMEVIFKSLSKDTFRRFLRQAGTLEEVMSLLDEADSQQLTG